MSIVSIMGASFTWFVNSFVLIGYLCSVDCDCSTFFNIRIDIFQHSRLLQRPLDLVCKRGSITQKPSNVSPCSTQSFLAPLLIWLQTQNFVDSHRK
jgi:hypothetical protein